MRALVLSGGGAYGAFEAGAIQGLLNRTSPGFFSFVCGTSIGALNAACFAAAAEVGLHSVWATLAKRKAASPALQQVHSALWESAHVGVLTRLYDAVRFLFGAFAGDYKSIYRSDTIKALLQEVLAPGGVQLPFMCDVLWTATDLTSACSRAFYYSQRSHH